MVSLSKIKTSNSLISTSLPLTLTALFVGATSGIGKITLNKFTQCTMRPRVYFIGRSQDAGGRILQELRTRNPIGEYHFIRADVSLIRVVDEICENIKSKEEKLDLLFMSQGVVSFDRSKTAEDLHLLAALNYYSRTRFILNLLPLLQHPTSLGRVVTIAGGSKEGALDETDFPALKVPLEQLRGHLCTLITLGFEGIARDVRGVSFVHAYPGTVETGLWRGREGPSPAAVDVRMEIGECGERCLFLATSGRFPSLGGEKGVKPKDETEVAVGVNGEIGSGVYSVGWDCESVGPKVLDLLRGLREKGVVEAVRRHAAEEFRRIEELNVE